MTFAKRNLDAQIHETCHAKAFSFASLLHIAVSPDVENVESVRMSYGGAFQSVPLTLKLALTFFFPTSVWYGYHYRCNLPEVNSSFAFI